MSKHFVVRLPDEQALSKWASQNEMKYTDQLVCLPSCPEAYELDTQYNESLCLRIGQEQIWLMNGDERIGTVHFDQMGNRTGDTYIVVTPILAETE